MLSVTHSFLALLVILGLTSSEEQYHDYIVIGAGPGGLQMGYFLKQANRDYVILERANVSGSFFTIYPRHDKLISINKRHTGKHNKEFNLRHDWNSLLSHDESLLFTKYSKQFFPPKDTLVKYLNDYQQKLGITVQFNTEISNITKEASGLFQMQDQNQNVYLCKTLIVATGMSEPNKVKFAGLEYTEGYEDMPLDPDNYEGQSVLILGRGNTAFEVADSIYGSTNVVHMVARSRVRLSWATHYVGDLRAVNNGLLDTYQLKSLDGLLEASVEDAKLVKRQDGKLYIEVADSDDRGGDHNVDNFALRDGYDRVIRCLGFKFNTSIFHENLKPYHGDGRSKKFLKLKYNYESANIPGMFVVGAASHYVDFRKSSGGFLHGFRYTARTLHRILEQRNHQKAWPTEKGHISNLLTKIVKRINEVSGLYQMFALLADVIAINEDGTSYEYIEEIPVHLVHEVPSLTGIQVDRMIVLVMEYGTNFSGPGKDIFRHNRAVGEPSEAFKSNFLHPILYYYEHLPTASDMNSREVKQLLPTPDRVHHMVEDFLTTWTSTKSHILPLRRFLENVTRSDLRSHFAESCLAKALIYNSVPVSCNSDYLNGLSLPGEHDLLYAAQEEVVSPLPVSDL